MCSLQQSLTITLFGSRFGAICRHPERSKGRWFMNRWNSSVDDLKATFSCAFANGRLTTEYLSEIEIGECACLHARSSILFICKTYRNKLAAAPSEAQKGRL